MIGEMNESVSAVMAVRDGERWVTSAIESLVDQTRPPDEIVVVDDGSTDRTLDVLSDLDRRFPSLLVVLTQPNRGAAAALNRAIGASSGEFVFNADCDDTFLPNRVADSIAIAGRTGADMVGGQFIGRVGRSNRIGMSRFATDPATIAINIGRGLDPVAHATMMIRRSSYDRFGGYRRLVRGEDLELMLRWAHQGARIVVSPEAYTVYRFGPNHFSLRMQTHWMIWTHYARAIPTLADDDVPTFDEFWRGRSRWPARREAFGRMGRLMARFVVGPDRLRR
jgi:glycosyltransferase involved in cell wall biosynthesis